MKHVAVVSLLALALVAGCGSSGSPAPAGANLTAQELVQQCLAGDLSDFAAVLDVLQGFLSGGTGTPTPQIDLLQGLLSGGRFPWTIDLDGDTVNDLKGTIHLEDATGKVFLPVDLATLIGGGGTPDLAAILAALPDGTTVHLGFELLNLPMQSTNTGTGDGTVVFEVAGGMVTNASGTGHLANGECDVNFSFADLGIAEIFSGGFPFADLGFDIAHQSQHAMGNITFDGTDMAKVRTRVGNGPFEDFEIPLSLLLPQ